jgi:hypothetical protein
VCYLARSSCGHKKPFFQKESFTKEILYVIYYKKYRTQTLYVILIAGFKRGVRRMIIDARLRPPYKSLQQVLAAAPGAPKPVKRSPLISGYERPQSMVQKSLEL